VRAPAQADRDLVVGVAAGEENEGLALGRLELGEGIAAGGEQLGVGGALGVRRRFVGRELGQVDGLTISSVKSAKPRSWRREARRAICQVPRLSVV
jgi:hypothetical protein